MQTERKGLAHQLLGDVRRLDAQLAASEARTWVAVAASGTTVTDVYGVGSIVAALLLGHTGDVRRFRSKNHYASCNATAPIEASSGPRVRHRLNPRGNRQLNHALQVAAVTQISHDTPGRVYSQRKLAEGKGKKEALRALKRRVSDAVYRQLSSTRTAADHAEAGREDNQGRLCSCVAGLRPDLPAGRISHSQTRNHHTPPTSRPRPAWFSIL